MMSIFLMGTYDSRTDQFCTVTKCGSGFDDKTLEQLNRDLRVVKISKVGLNLRIKKIKCIYNHKKTMK